MKEWRPDGWDERRKEAIAEMGKLPNQTEFPIVIPDSFDWAWLKSQLYEAGADAMLGALKKQVGTCYCHKGDEAIYSYELDESGWLVFIEGE